MTEQKRIRDLAKHIVVTQDLSDFDFESDFHPVMKVLHETCHSACLGPVTGVISCLLAIDKLTNARIDYLAAG